MERLEHMLQAVTAIEAYAARGRAAFDADSALRDATLYQIIVLGEAAKGAVAADPDLVSRVPNVAWSPVARMRDRVAHHYWTTDLDVGWTTATVAVPELRVALQEALGQLK